MAIPKEPRQIMINIMYLVLTALLALNVSAEIFNAFKVVDDGLINANASLDRANAPLPAVINERSKKKKDFEKYADRTAPARKISKDLADWIDVEIIDKLVDEGGNRDGVHDDGDYDEYKGTMIMKGLKNKDVTTKYLVEGGKGDELKAKILEAREAYMQLFDDADRESHASSISLEIDDETWKTSINKHTTGWSHYNFNHMPIGATLPIFRKYINDAKSSEAAVLNYLVGKVGGEDIVLDKFLVVSSPKKTYIINGERFETDVFLSAAASNQSNTEITIKVNGQTLAVNENGEAKYAQTASGVGLKKYRANISVFNPTTQETKEYTGEFEYEVGERSVSVSATKMNVFYMGVDNPVEVSAAGITTSDLTVTMSGPGGGAINKNADGTYTVTVAGPPTKPTETANINVSDRQKTVSFSKGFRVKRIPDPVARLSTKSGGAMSSGEFKAQGGVSAILDNFDFDARCQIDGFRLVRVAPRQDPEVASNGGARWTPDAAKIVNKAKAGDRFFFENVKARCPGDKAGRTINSMVFTIR